MIAYSLKYEFFLVQYLNFFSVRYFFLIVIFVFSCEERELDEVQISAQKFEILSLGDSYTVGQGVCEDCSYPKQLIDSLRVLHTLDTFNLEIIAQNGWTTSSLLNNIEVSEIERKNIVTLLIGVNNQYGGLPFDQYENEFEELISTSISLTKSQNSDDLIVISIPDWAYTSFGQNYNLEFISGQIESYNQFTQNYCYENNISYVYITDITRLGLIQPELVAPDGLHPSATAHNLFVNRILPVIEQKIYRTQ